MGFTIDFSVLNQKGTPALYSDIFANRPAAGYQGRLFIATDTAAIYEDTGTAWTLIANVSSGAGTLQQVTTNGNTSNVGISVTAGGVSTNSLTDTSLTTGSVPFAGTGGLISEDNANLFWDDTNNRLGINTNTPGNSLDVHTNGSNPTIAINNTAALQSAISFLNTSVAKWRIGNTAINSFDIYNFTLAAYAMTINNASNAVVMSGTLNANEFNLQPNGYSLLASLSRNLTGAGYGVLSLRNSANGTIQPSSLTVDRTYTLPDATGTIALTSDLSSYLLLTGGNLTGNITVSVNTGLSALTLNNASLSGRNWSFINTTNGADTDLSLFYSGTSGGTKVTFLNSGNVAINGSSFDINPSSGNPNITLRSGNTFRGYIEGNSSGGLSFGAGSSATIYSVLTSIGNFLIGSTTDDTVNKLQVTGSAKITSRLNVNGATDNASYVIQGKGNVSSIDSNNQNTVFLAASPTASYIATSWIGGGGAVPLYIQNNGINAIGISTASVINIINLAGTGSRAVLADASGNLSAPVSDISVKENIEPLKYGLDTIMKLNAVQFQFIEGYKNYGEGLQIGAIAQEVEQIIPEAVFKTPSTELKGIDYNQFHAIYIKAIQDQQKIIESLIQRIELLENK